MVIKSSFAAVGVSALVFFVTAFAVAQSQQNERNQPSAQKQEETQTQEKTQSQKGMAQESKKEMMQNRSQSIAEIDELHKASDVIGKTVQNAQGEELGEIADIAIDGEGRIRYAVLSFGGFLGMGDKYFAVPWGELRRLEEPGVTGARTAFVLDVEKKRLQSAPGFDKNNWPDMASEEWRSEVDTFYREGGKTQEQNPESRTMQESGTMR